MATSGLPPASSPGQKITELTKKAVARFAEFLEENVPLTRMDKTGHPKFYSTREIMLVAKMAKSQVISDFKFQLATEASEDEHSVETRVESLEDRLQTVVNAHLKQNSRIWGTMESSLVTDLIKRLSEDFEKFHKENPLPETEKLKEHHEILKANTMNSWSKLKKPNCADFIRDTQEKLQSKMNHFCSEYLEQHEESLRKLQEEGEAEVAKLVRDFETELLTERRTIYCSVMNEEWTETEISEESIELSEESIELSEEWVELNKEWKEKSNQLYEKALTKLEHNPFPETHSCHGDLYNFYARQLEETRLKIDREGRLVETGDLIRDFERELLARKHKFDITRNEEWKKISVKLRQYACDNFKLTHLNPQDNYDGLSAWFEEKLDEAQNHVDRQRWVVICPDAIRRCLAKYLISIESHLYEKDYVQEVDLEAFSALARKKVKDEWEAWQIKAEYVPEFQMELENKISRGFSILQKQVGALNAEVEWKAKLLVKKCQAEYIAGMRLETGTSHQREAERVQKMLWDEYPIKSKQFILKYQTELNSFLETVENGDAKCFEREDDMYTNIGCLTPQTQVKKQEKARSPYFSQLFNLWPSEITHWPEEKCFETLYREELRIKLDPQTRIEDNQTKDELEAFNRKLESAMLSAFKTLALVEGRSESELPIRLENLEQAFALMRHQQILLVRILKKVRANFSDKSNFILYQHPDGLHPEDLANLVKDIQSETLKLLEVEVREKIGEEEPLKPIKDILQREISVAWDFVMTLNEENLQKWENEPPRALPPLAFHLQSRYVSVSEEMEMIENNNNERGETCESPVVLTLVGNQKQTFIYGDKALRMVESVIPPNFVWTLANFFKYKDPSWSKTVSVGGKEYKVTSEFMLGYLLRKMKTAAERKNKGKYFTAVLVIPFWLSSAQRMSVKDAAKLAGFCNVHLVNEASVVALDFAATCLDHKLPDNKIRIFCENMDRMDSFVYSYSSVDHKLQMVSHFGNYRMHEELKFHLKSIPPRFQTNGYKVEDINRVGLIANDFAYKEVGKFKADGIAYFAENLGKWEKVLSSVSNNFEYLDKASKNYIYGDILPYWPKTDLNSSKIGSMIQDKLAWDVFQRRTNFKNTFILLNRRERVIRKEDGLPVESTRYSVSLKKCNEPVTFYQSVLKSEHLVGHLVVKGVQPTQTVEPIFEINNEGIVTLNSVRICPNTSDWTDYLTDENIEWNNFCLSARELESLYVMMLEIFRQEQD